MCVSHGAMLAARLLVPPAKVSLLLLNQQKILVVEDEIIIAMDLADILRDAGAEVVGPALAVPEALRLIDSNEVSLAVLDVQLGTDNSKSVAHRLAAADIPYVFHTGNRTAALLDGEWPRAPIVKKPVEPRILIAALLAVAKNAS